MTRFFRHGGLFAALLITACAGQKLPLPQLTLDGRVCDVKPMFDGALPVPFDTRSGVDATLGAQGRCLKTPHASVPTTYASLALPQGVAPSMVTVNSLANVTLVLPRATFYDAVGTTVRVLAPEDFRVGVGGLQAGVRLRGIERWMVVEADRAMLGKPVPIPGAVRETLAMYALNGTVRVTVAPVLMVP